MRQQIAGGLLGLVFGASLLLGLAPVARGATPQQADAAIKKAQEFLLSHAKNGNWEEVAAPANDVAHEVVGRQWGGLSAIATYSLLASGVSPQDPQMRLAIDFLRKANLEGTYALGLRAQIWKFLLRGALTTEVRKQAQLDVAMFLNGMNEKGMYTYSCKSKVGSDNKSTSQYGVLGMWGCERAGAEVPPMYWRKIEEGWTRDQAKDGGWAYMPNEATSVTMTLAGVATLYVAQEYLNRDAGIACKGNIVNPAIDRGLEWLGKKGPALYDQGGRTYYAMYGVERVGVASGRKYFGNLNWYDVGADILVKTQRPDGSWFGPEGKEIGNTAFGILFLVRGRAPVVINKLEYSIDTAGDAKKVANWNQRPRDVANFTNWLGEMVIERDLNWQIVNLKVAPVEDLHDSQILYISGNQPLQLGKEVEDKIKLFVEQGGLVVGHADCGHTGFADSFTKLGTRLFGGEFRQLPAEHPILTIHFDAKKWPTRPAIKALSNGVRELMVLLPTDDAGKSWQLQSFKTRAATTELMGNLVLYSVDKDDKNLRFKGDSYIVKPDPKAAVSRTVKLARVQYPGNWDPEPGGWRRLSAILRNSHQTDLLVEPLKIGEGKLFNYKLAHLTGTEKLNIDEKGKAELKDFVTRGGMLIVDAAGGSRTFGLSAETDLEAIFGAKFQPIAPTHAALAAEPKIETFGYRRFAKKNLGRLNGPTLKYMEIGGRPAVFYSGEDLSAGLVGQQIDGIIGYDPATATAIMRNLVLFSPK